MPTLSQFVPIDTSAFYGGYVMLPHEGSEDHFMMGADQNMPRGQAIYPDFMKPDAPMNNQAPSNY